MSWQAACKIYVPKFTSKYYIDQSQVVYMGVGNDGGFFNYYLYGVGWIISTSFYPLKVTVDGTVFSCRMSELNGYCFWNWTYDYRSLYAAPFYINEIGGNWNRPSFFIYMKDFIQPGCIPVQYSYTENNTTYYRRQRLLLLLDI